MTDETTRQKYVEGWCYLKQYPVTGKVFAIFQHFESDVLQRRRFECRIRVKIPKEFWEWEERQPPICEAEIMEDQE